MRFVDHDDGVIFIGQVTDLIQLRDSAIHAERPIRHDDPAPRLLSGLQLRFQVLHIVVLIPESLRLAQPHPVDDGCMVQLIGNNGVLVSEQRFEDTSVGIECRRI